ncbi:hypothetical protein [Streptomyces sp. Amel2xC10]|uniref:hypothetical protein n=1 Tax=Streptomyces sp. Amel2xC10 TaxID=1305826 RepID=UPI000A08DF14|nr:hypothetical protein [Streptomyces sp. Amel2xC10]SMF58599.1 hypothetical protein SAMN02745830_04611 [Streptomyces sp. Amel2xC10]
MRKLHKVALVAAMIGSLGMAGAGVAAAGDGGKGRECTQGAATKPSINNGLINIPNLNLPLLGNLTESTAIQQSCVNGNDSGTLTGSGIGTEQSGGLLGGLLG